jgi:hypothetical protein
MHVEGIDRLSAVAAVGPPQDMLDEVDGGRRLSPNEPRAGREFGCASLQKHLRRPAL